ncbi:hypothetical protein DDR33_16445 [Pararcticibacter amylolyticus]|uniref:DUF4397 domain-containing protein n=2 Tax=Pararcticibacter amylolyticus TaxID=2173175 RepID=A0A2U2PE20_9SPHI|nr:hypothetical protein DDR33_16445 [Pararcticibacter amylolyticus]
MGLSIFLTKGGIRVLLLFAWACMLASCVEGDDENRPLRSYVNFVNSREDSNDGVDFMIDGNRLRTGSVEVDSASGYNQIYSGNREISVVPNGGSASDLLTKNTGELIRDKYYSCFLAGTASQKNLVLTEDNFTAPDSVKHAKVRFVNLSSAAGKVDVSIRDNKNLFTGQEYLNVSQYTTIDTSRHTIDVYIAGTNTGSLSSIDFHPRSRKIYTLYLRGAPQNKYKLWLRENKR